MKKRKTFKSKWYVVRKRNDSTYTVVSKGYKTESAAWDSMFERDREAYDPQKPSQIPMKRRQEYEDCRTMKGEIILKYPKRFIGI